MTEPMTEPLITQRQPYPMDLEPGDYFWCACGRSAKQPFCDGSHKGTGITPVKFSIEEPKRVFLCGCRHSGTPPFCDGSHSTLEE